jgi:(2Fe-2S) ferredoxin
MDQRSVPYKKTVFVCTNKRDEATGRVACANPGRGGEEICASLKDAVKNLGLKKRIRVARSGCLDLCERGPNVFVHPDGAWYGGVKLEDVPELIKKLTE